jgi:hypothetical protein
MKTILLAVISVTLLLSSCIKKTQPENVSSTPDIAKANVPESSEGYTLLKNNCYVCHSVTTKSHDEIIAPPMIAVKRRYQNQYATKEGFVEAVVNWAKNPTEEKSLMRGAVQRFKVMPKQAFKEDDLKKIAAYIYDTEIEQPAWFEAHFKEQHGSRGKGMGMQGQNNWKQQMKLDNGNTWTANIETTQGIEKLQEIVSNDKFESINDYKILAKKLSGELTVILDKCTMKGASHDNLHIFLVPLLKKVDKLKEVTSVAQGKMITDKIRTHLKEYKSYFN